MVERIRSRGYTDRFGDVTVRLAKDFGFCYGVDRAVDYAYETVHKFPDKSIYLVGEIILPTVFGAARSRRGMSAARRERLEVREKRARTAVDKTYKEMRRIAHPHDPEKVRWQARHRRRLPPPRWGRGRRGGGRRR